MQKLHYKHRALLKADLLFPTLGNATREAGKAPEKEKNTTDELSGEGGEGWGTNYKKESATPSTLKQQGKPQTKGKCHCTRTLQCAVRHKLGKSPISFPSSLSISARRKHTHVLAAP